MLSENFKAGDFVAHFKRELLTEEERKNSLKFLYMVLDIATDTKDGDDVVVYRALYPDENGRFNMFVRKKDEFCSEIDRTKYPDIKQERRFKVISM